jgi:hypothetical protein
MLDTMGQDYKSDKITVTLGNVKAVLNNKRTVNSAKALGVSQLALILAACGSSDDTATVSAPTTLLSLTKSGDNYSASNVTGFSVADQTSATFDVADAATNTYAIKLDATGTGTLHFDFADASDAVMLQAGSKVAGFTTLKVSDGSIDATNADLSSITRVEVASGIKITLAQIKTIPTIVSNSATGKIEVEVASEAEATELVSLMTDGTVNVFGGANPIDFVAAPTAPATLTADVLTAKVTETTATLKAVTEAPAVVVDATPVAPVTPVTPVVPVTPVTPTAPVSTVEEAIRFTMSGDASGNFTPGFYSGDVTVTASGSNYVVTPASGTAIESPTSGVSSFVVNSITMNAEAAVLDGETITGTGNVALTKLEGDAAADLSLITNTGTRTATVSDDVTFTGDLGTFTTTVNSGKTLTADVDQLSGKTIDGAGTVALTDLDTLLAADLSGISSTTFTAAFNADGTFTGDLGAAAITVASTKTLTTTVMKAAGKDIDGAGNATLTGGVTDNADLTNIDITGTLAFDSNTTAITAAKTLTLDAVQASKATSGITGAGNLTITDDGGAANSTIVSAVTNAGIITIDAGTGNDTINIGVAANVEADDTIDGGGGTDELKITADGNSTGAIVDDVVDIDTITLVKASNATVKLTLQYTSANTDAITITGAALTGGTAAMTLVATDAQVDGNLTVTDTAGADSITTGDGDDSITVTPVSAKADAVTGDAGTDKLIFGTATIDVSSGTIQVNLAPGTSDQIATENNFFTGNQTGLENFDLSGLTLTNPNAVASEFLNLNTTTDLTTTSLKGTVSLTDKITDIATGVDMTPITNTGIEVIDLADAGVTVDMDVANFTNVTALTGGSGTDVVKLAEAAAFDLSAITTFAGITTFNMNVTSKIATSLKINQTGSNDFGGAAAVLTGASGTAQTLSLTDSGDAVIVIQGITNANVETISLVDDDDDLTIDVANMQHVTAFNGVASGNVEKLILDGASTFDFSTVTVSNLTITGTDSDTQVIESGIGANTIALGGTTAGDTLVYGAANQRGDSVSQFQVGNNKDILNLKAATTYKSGTAEGIKAGTLANFDSYTEIKATTQHGAVVLSDTNLTTSAALVTAFNATDFDTTADASVIVVWEDSDNGSGVVEMGVLTNAATADGDDVTYATIATFTDLTATSAFHAFNFDIVA